MYEEMKNTYIVNGKKFELTYIKPQYKHYNPNSELSHEYLNERYYPINLPTAVTEMPPLDDFSVESWSVSSKEESKNEDIYL